MANLNKIRDLCDSRKITLKELTEKVGLSQAGLQYLLNENNTKVDTLEKIAQVLNVPVAVFFDEGTPEDSRRIISELKEEIEGLNTEMQILQMKWEELDYLCSLYEDTVKLIDNELLPLIQIDKLTELETEIIIKYDLCRAKIFEQEEEDPFDYKNPKTYKPFYVKSLKKVIEDQQRKIAELNYAGKKSSIDEQ